MKYSKIYEYCQNEGIDSKEVLENLYNDESDFTVDDCRFIRSDEIDEIQKEELLNDTYMLGCFNDWFIADITGLDVDVIKKAQKDESFELLGELMAKNIDDVQQKYASSDGYGHHFNSYDGSEDEMCGYYIFKGRA